MTEESIAERIDRLIRPSLEAMGYELWRVQMGGGKARRTLQVMVERADRRPITVGECAEVSRALSALLDVDDPISGAYTLEVSSPGIDRPLIRPGHFARYVGHVAKVETVRPFDGRRRFRGRIAGVVDDGVRIAFDEGETLVPFEAIQRAKLVMTDELLAAPQGAEN